MIVPSNTAAQTIQPGAAATFDAVKPHTGRGEFHRTGSGSVRLRAGPYAFDFTGNVGGAAGTQAGLAIAVDGGTSPETAMTEAIALATVVNTGSTAIEPAASPALAVKREA